MTQKKSKTMSVKILGGGGKSGVFAKVENSLLDACHFE